jgi:hypothetical protein
MNNRSILRALALSALVVAGAAALAIGAYNAGVAQGIAQSGALAAPAAGAQYAVYPYMWYRPWGFGLFPIFPFFFVLLFFFALRGLFWRWPWHGGWGPRYHAVPAEPASERASEPRERSAPASAARERA